MEAYEGFRVRDNVWIAANPRPNSVQWVITAIYQAANGLVYATVNSPFSARSRVVPIERLTLHSSGRAA